MIKTSGYRVGPFEVESALMSHPAVLEVAITGVPDPVRGQVVKATVVLTKGNTLSEELKKEIQDSKGLTTEQSSRRKQTITFKYTTVYFVVSFRL
jgi:acyl-coenzyme A synthetase/AMP-(fatty) acid ligase